MAEWEWVCEWCVQSEKTEKARAKEVKKMSVPESAPFRNCTCYDKNLPTGFRGEEGTEADRSCMLISPLLLLLSPLSEYHC